MSDPNVLTVQADSADSLGWAILGPRRWRCMVGAGGIREDKVEGDAATPAGEFPLRRILFRNDRLVLPKVRLPARPISEHDGWCDDPRSPDLQPPGPHSQRLEPREDVARGRALRPASWWWATTTIRPRANGAARSSSTSPARIMRRPGAASPWRATIFCELVTLIGPGTRLNVLSTPAAEQMPPAGDEPDMKLVEDFDEKDW